MEKGGGLMNSKQRKTLILVATIVTAMLLFPPFHIHRANGVIVNLGYAFLFAPPTAFGSAKGTVDVAVLFAQWLGIILVGGIVFFIQKDYRVVIPKA